MARATGSQGALTQRLDDPNYLSESRDGLKGAASKRLPSHSPLSFRRSIFPRGPSWNRMAVGRTRAGRSAPSEFLFGRQRPDLQR